MTFETRVRALSSDSRAGSFARGEIRRAQREFIRRHWLFLTGTAAAIAGSSVVAALIERSAFQRGLIIGSGFTAAAAVTMHFVVVLTGSGPRGMGEAAEQWTAQELRPLQKHDWLVVNHVSLDAHGDIDHVLLGPGGVFVVETKWGATPWRMHPGDKMLGATTPALQRRTRSLQLALQRHLGPAKVSPLIVLWGRAAAEIVDETSPVAVPGSDVGVIAGVNLRDWALRRGRSHLSTPQIQGAWQELDRYAGYTDAREEAIPEAISGVLFSSALAVAAGLISFIGLIQVGRLPYGWAWGAVPSAALLVVATWVRRRRAGHATARRLLTGLAAGAGITMLIWIIVPAWALLGGDPTT